MNLRKACYETSGVMRLNRGDSFVFNFNEFDDVFYTTSSKEIKLYSDSMHNKIRIDGMNVCVKKTTKRLFFINSKSQLCHIRYHDLYVTDIVDYHNCISLDRGVDSVFTTANILKIIKT